MSFKKSTATLWASFLFLAPSYLSQAAAGTQPLVETAPPEARAHWLTMDLIAWDAPVPGPVILSWSEPSDRSAKIVRSRQLAPAGTVSGGLGATVPHLKGMRLYRITSATRNEVSKALKGHVSVAVRRADGASRATSGLQIGGVLDDLYANDAPLGVNFAKGVPTVRLWAPTANAVRLRLYDGPNGGEAVVLPMVEDAATGVWRISGARDWNRKHYQFEVTVHAPSVGRLVTNLVTDPYSLNLSAEGERSQIIDLQDSDLKPEGWDRVARSLPEAPEDIAIYELHVRDFSIADETAPRSHRGKFLAFSDTNSDGMRHLHSLAQAGLTHVQLLPTFDCATVPERASRQKTPPDLSRMGPASEKQQAAIAAVRADDAFNWCYDPLHFMAPDGSYASNPDGPARVLEFRKMVRGLDRIGLGAVLDVVFNHTTAAGQARFSVSIASCPVITTGSTRKVS